MTTLPRILLVDDDYQLVRFFKRILEEHGFSVTGTTSGKHARDLLDEALPDLLILDLNMPEPDGFDLLKVERSKFPSLKILVISGYLQGPLLEAAKIFGAVATLEKPLTSEDLISKVREVLAKPAP